MARRFAPAFRALGYVNIAEYFLIIIPTNHAGTTLIYRDVKKYIVFKYIDNK